MSAIRKMFEKARRMVISRGAPVEDADDIIQEAFARMESYMRVQAVENQEAFLMRVALNVSRDQAKHQKNAPFAYREMDVDLIANSSPQPDEVVRAKERLRRAKSGLDQLDEATRRCLFAQRLEGLTFAEIAARERLPITTVEKRVARAIVFLTKWMDAW